MKKVLFIAVMACSFLVSAQSKPTKFQIFSKSVNADGTEIKTKEEAQASNHSEITFAIEMNEIENVSMFHISLGIAESDASSVGTWKVPFIEGLTADGLNVEIKDKVVYIHVGVYENMEHQHATAKIEYKDGSTSANVVYSK